MERFKVHIPPKYNQYGNSQFWFIEIENSRVDELINGALFALGPVALFYATALVYQGGVA